MDNKVIARIKGGLGNQLFCYAAARRLALVNDAELVIDSVTGFVRDRQYRRKYALDHFHIPARTATPAERLEPFERYRRGLAKFIAGKRPFHERRYIEENGNAFDCRLLDLRIRGTVYLDGLWQSERYFNDVEDVIRKDLAFVTPTDPENRRVARLIERSSEPVSIHIRWLSEPGRHASTICGLEYYRKAIEHIQQKVGAPKFFVFSDYPEHLDSLISGLESFEVVRVNSGRQDMAYADMWLMTLCRHHIFKDSTFGWWGAWLGEKESSIVSSPGLIEGKMGAWGFHALIPNRWSVL